MYQKEKQKLKKKKKRENNVSWRCLHDSTQGMPSIKTLCMAAHFCALWLHRYLFNQPSADGCLVHSLSFVIRNRPMYNLVHMLESVDKFFEEG